MISDVDENERREDLRRRTFLRILLFKTVKDIDIDIIDINISNANCAILNRSTCYHPRSLPKICNVPLGYPATPKKSKGLWHKTALAKKPLKTYCSL